MARTLLVVRSASTLLVLVRLPVRVGLLPAVVLVVASVAAVVEAIVEVSAVDVVEAIVEVSVVDVVEVIVEVSVAAVEVSRESALPLTTRSSSYCLSLGPGNPTYIVLIDCCSKK